MKDKILPTALISFILSFSFSSLRAQTRISGPQSGTLGPGIYIVEGNISVPADSALWIMPGAEFQHIGGYVWEIYGGLNAEGAFDDSIKFIRQNLVNEHRWRGIRFLMGASDSSSLDYCVIEHCYHYFTSFFGGGIYVESVPVSITNCRVSNCEGWPEGGGIYVFNADVTIDNCIITDNSAPELGNGGGVYFDMCGSSTVNNCIITRNRATSGG